MTQIKMEKIYQILQNNTDQNKLLKIGRSDLPEPFGSLFPRVFGSAEKIEFENVELQNEENRVGLNAIGLTAPLKGMNVSIDFFGGTENTYNLRAEKETEWDIMEQFPELQHTLLEDTGWNNVVIESDTDSDRLNFTGELQLSPEMGVLKYLPLAGISLEGWIAWKEGAPTFNFSTAVNNQHEGSFLDQVHLRIGLECDFDRRKTLRPALFIEGTPTIMADGQEIHIPLRATLSNFNQHIRLKADVRELSEFGMNELQSVLHNHTPDFSNILDGKLDVVESFRVEFIQITIDPTLDEKIEGIEMNCGFSQPIELFPLPSGQMLKMTDTVISLRLNHPFNNDKRSWLISAHSDFPITPNAALSISVFAPELEFQAGLSAPLSFSDLIAFISNTTDLELPELEIQELQMIGNYSEKSFEVMTLLGANTELDLADSQLLLRDLHAGLSYKDEAFKVQLKSQIEWYGFWFQMEGAFESDGGVTFKGEIIQKQPVNLVYVMNLAAHELGLDFPADFPVIELHQLALGFNTKKGNYHFEAEVVLKDDHLGVLDISLTSDTRVMLDASKKKGQTQIVAELSSKLDIGGQHFDLRTHIGKDHQLVYASWEAEEEGLRLSQLIQAFDKEHSNSEYNTNGVDLDLMLKSIAFEYDHSGSEHKLVARAITEIDIAGKAHDLQVFIVAWKNNGWRFLFGIEYDDNAAHLGHLKGPNQDAFSGVDLVKLKKAALVFASGDFTKFTLPDLPKFKDEDDAPNLLLSNHELKIQKGVYAITEVEFNGSSEGIERFNDLSKHTPDDGDLLIQAGYNAQLKAVTIDILLEGDIVIPGKTREEDFKLSDARFHIELPKLSFFLSGKAKFNIDHHQIIARGGIGISTEEVIGEFEVDLSDSENPDNVSFFGLNDLFLDDILFVLGVNFTHGSIEFGGEIGLHHKGAPIDSDKMGLILEIIDGIPNPQFFELQIDEIDFARVMELFSGTDSDGHAKHSEVIKARIEDLYLYWAQKKVRLMDREILPGFAFKGTFDFFNIQAWLNVKVGEEYGIMGEIHVSPIHIENVVSVVGDGEAVVIKKYKDDNGEWHKIPEATVRELPDGTETDDFTIVEAGGPVVILNSNESPYLHADVQVRLLDLITLNVSANINDDSFDFDFLLNANNILAVELHCDMNDKKSFRAFGGFHLGVDFDLSIEFFGEMIGIHIDFGMDIEVALGFINEDKKKPDDLDRGAYLYFSFKGNFLGIHIGPFEMALTLDVSELEKIPGKALESIKNQLFSSVQDVLDFIFDHDKYVRDKRRQAAEQQRSGSKSNHQKYIDDVRKQWNDNRKKDLDRHHNKSKESNFSKILNDLSIKRTAMYHGSRAMADRIDAVVGNYAVTVTGEVREILELTESYKQHFGNHADFVQEDRFTNEEAIQMSKWNTQAEQWRKGEHVSEIHKNADDQISAIQGHVKTASEAAVNRAKVHFDTQK